MIKWRMTTLLFVGVSVALENTTSVVLHGICPENPSISCIITDSNKTETFEWNDVLELTNKNITIIESLPPVSILDLSFNRITSLPSSTTLHITQLILRNNSFQDIPVQRLPASLLLLDMSGNSIASLNQNFSSLKNFTTLILRQVNLSEVRQPHFHESFNYLDIRGNRNIKTFEISSATRDTLQASKFYIESFTLGWCSGSRETRTYDNGRKIQVCVLEPVRPDTDSTGTIILKLIGAAAGLVLFAIAYLLCAKQMLTRVYMSYRYRRSFAGTSYSTRMGSAMSVMVPFDPIAIEPLKTSLSRYELDEPLKLIKVLDTTTYGEIYLAKYKNAKVSYKLLQPAFSHEGVARYVQEIQTLSNLSHPCLLNFLGFTLTTCSIGILTEYAPKGRFVNLLEFNPSLELHHKLVIALDIASAISYLHSLSIIHKQVNTSHVVVTDNLRGKLAGFATDEEGECTIAPEIEIGGACTAASDIYMFGLMLQEIHLEPKVSEEKTTPLNTCPADVHNLVEKCLNRAVDSRPPITEVLQRLQDAIQSLE